MGEDSLIDRLEKSCLLIAAGLVILAGFGVSIVWQVFCWRCQG